MHCEKYNCELSEQACVKRQKMARLPKGGNAIHLQLRGDIGCIDCQQGKKIMQDHQTDNPIVNQNVAKTAVCVRCGDEKSIEDDFYKNPGKKSGHDSTCKTCRKKLSYQNQKKKKEQSPVSKALSQDKPPEVPIIEEGGRSVLRVDFTNYPEVLKAVREIAKFEVRSVEEQVLWWTLRKTRQYAGESIGKKEE